MERNLKNLLEEEYILPEETIVDMFISNVKEN